MGKLVQMKVKRAPDPLPLAERAGLAMREAREAAGLDPCEAAQRLNAACGTSIISAALLGCWEAGAEVPDVCTWIRAIRLAGEQAVYILAGLA